MITTTTSGSQDIYIVLNGRVLLFVPTFKYSKLYKRLFMIVCTLGASQIFNEQSCLFGQDCYYGSMAMDDQVELLHIDKANFSKLSDINMLEDLRLQS